MGKICRPTCSQACKLPETVVCQNGGRGRLNELIDCFINSNGDGDDKELRQEIRTLGNGAKYEGEWNGKQRHGYGVQVWVGGARYQGQWKNDKAHGAGKFSHQNGDVFEGQWQDDKA